MSLKLSDAIYSGPIYYQSEYDDVPILIDHLFDISISQAKNRHGQTTSSVLKNCKQIIMSMKYNYGLQSFHILYMLY